MVLRALLKERCATNELLARKSALLDAAVSLGIDGVRPLSYVLETSTGSITVALNRRIQAGDIEEMVLGLCLHRKKRGGRSDYVKHCIELWWNVQTKVSPNRKDVIKHRVDRKDWAEPHPTHYLCDSQVC